MKRNLHATMALRQLINIDKKDLPADYQHLQFMLILLFRSTYLFSVDWCFVNQKNWLPTLCLIS